MTEATMEAAIIETSTGLNDEQKRIKTFASWPINYPVDPNRLAKAGFYFTGKDDEVICFSCNGCIKNWNYGDIVQKKHAELFPHCDFVNNRSNNVPFTLFTKNASDVVKSIYNKNGFQSPEKEELSVTERNSVNNLLSPNALESNIKETNEEISNYVPDYDKMKFEDERLKTFTKKWPVTFLDVSEIVQAGFFYLGFEDKVQCPFCRGIVSNWSVGDIPLNEHRKHFPWCSFVISITCNKSKSENVWYEHHNQDICSAVEQLNCRESTSKEYKLLDKKQHLHLQNLGVQFYKGPAYPQQAMLSARLRSFVEWPVSTPVSKEDLANAGFFYIGINDNTRCFHCGGGLCNWEQDDDPWIEHAKWFYNCDFLQLNKDKSFIQHWAKAVGSETHSGNDGSSISSQDSSGSSFLLRVDEAMKSNIVQCVIDTELFPLYVIRAAIVKQIKECGTMFSNADELGLAVSYLKDEMENDHTKIFDASVMNIQERFEKKISVENEIDCKIQSMPKTSDAATETVGVPVPKTEEGNSDFKEQCICKICMDREVGVVFLPCGHLLSCTLCAPALKTCPMCRQIIVAIVKAFLL